MVSLWSAWLFVLKSGEGKRDRHDCLMRLSYYAGDGVFEVVVARLLLVCCCADPAVL
jgi:hypothetical protein